ncbi:CBF-domain-containing protein [Trichodelitschia bisporula]|uniref:CBF-domain-containing protein n=1 Tax=Trichodelitschia bisporula TaxID=703511 RepID=A0A6G1HYS1_9PEZI|nr:CBF-domain-containing protein [Trichodelitschia bisporula]
MGRKRSASDSHGHPSKKPKDYGDKSKDRSDKPATYTHSQSRPKKADEKPLIFKPRPDWHAAELPPLPTKEKPDQPSQALLAALQKHADALLEAENAQYYAVNLTQSSHKFLSTIMASGTLEDKVSALTLVVQESPLHTKKSFETLVGLARKKSRNQAIMALAALKDLLGQGVVLPPDRKLRAFGRQPELIAALQGVSYWKSGDLPGQLQDVHLIAWAYEDWLKHTYFELLKVLEAWCNDEIEYTRNRAITFVWELLKEKPEQEENLLRLLINKLGDTEKKVASRASYLLLQLQATHPVMKLVIINAMETELLLRPTQTWQAKYYATITLNQTVLSQKEQDVANRLLEIYFKLFVTLLKHDPAPKDRKPAGKMNKKAKARAKLAEAKNKGEEELREKVIAQILTGVNRAFPFADTDSASFEGQLDTLYRVVHSSNFNTTIQALMLIQQITASKQYTADRFYRTLYSTLHDPRLLSSSKQIMYLNLLYRSLKSDVNIKRVQGFVKRLLQVISMHEPPFACGVIYLVYELKRTFPGIKTMLSEPESTPEDEEESFHDVDEDAERDVAPKPMRSATTYDGRKRDPEFSNADRSCLWELLPLQMHYHPSVSLFASRLLLSEEMPEKPDPTVFTLMHFLDRFAYRNAKAKATSLRGNSIMQPLAGAHTSDLLIKGRSSAKGAAPLNTEAFWAKKTEEVAPDEAFFHQYFSKVGKTKNRAERRAEKEDSEDEIWDALVKSRPEIEGDDELDFDDMEGLAEAMAEDSDEEDGDLEDMDDADESDGGVEFVDEDGNVGLVSEGEDDFAALESDEEVLVASDDEVPSDFEELVPEKEKSKAHKDRKERKKLKQLPTFASAEDYAKLIDADEDESF